MDLAGRGFHFAQVSFERCRTQRTGECMGMINGLWALLFGNGRNVIAETAGAFQENAENAAIRAAITRSDALQQFASEFGIARQGRFDRFIDGLNRLPRPAMAFGTVGLIVSAMVAPDWFSARMAGLALVPEPLWWLMGAIISFYFGARYQAKSLEFGARDPSSKSPKAPAATNDIWTHNAALDDWRQQNGR